jgi:release factor glutamine methyltransferase
MNEAELLFSQVLNCDRISLYLNSKETLDKEKSLFISSVLKRRTQGEPIQYILGKTEFMGLEFKLTPDVLIPRPETEILVDVASEYIRKRAPQGAGILDLGTGSGCIAVSLARLFPGARITASDISSLSLEVARDNAKLNGVAIEFIRSDLFDSLRINSFDFIVSNPPYIAKADIAKLQPEVRREPIIALDGGKDGLDFYKRIIKESCDYLKEGGFLIMEIGFNQGKDVENISQNLGGYEIIKVIKDYNNIDRVVVAKRR